jgi:hypothetical protein
MKHYLLTATHKKNTVWVVRTLPGDERLVGAVVAKKGKFYTEAIDSVGHASGPHKMQGAAIQALLAAAPLPAHSKSRRVK